MAIDVHVHSKGGEDGNRILKAMDEAGLEHILLMSRPPHWSLATEEEDMVGHQSVIDDIARMVAPDPTRLIGFAWIEPSLPDAANAVDYALGEKGLRGVKMIPHGWFPDDPRAQACYAKINGYGAPMLFHSGILWSWGNTSKYCRPAEFEIMMEYPQIRFGLAHMSWPWTDECIAVCQKLQHMQPSRGHEWTCYIDITTGAPRLHKTNALRTALALVGDSHLVYGSDCADPENPKAYLRNLREDEDILREAGASAEVIDRVLSQNAKRWLGVG